MKEYMVDAIILKSVSAKEADRILTLYTRQSGKVRVAAHGVEKPASKKRGAVQPFSYSRLLLRRGRDLDSVSQGECVNIFQGLRQNLEVLAKASYMVELVDAFTVDGDSNSHVFELLLDAFSLLGHGCDNTAARAFEIKLMSFLGYRPGLDSCVTCGSAVNQERVFFAPGQGGIVCNTCRPGSGEAAVISRGSLETMKAFLRWEMGRIHQIRTGSRQSGEIKKIMRRFIEYQLERGIRSVRFEDLIEKAFGGSDE